MLFHERLACFHAFEGVLIASFAGAELLSEVPYSVTEELIRISAPAGETSEPFQFSRVLPETTSNEEAFDIAVRPVGESWFFPDP